MGTTLGDALARAGLISKREADQAARVLEAARRRTEDEKARRQAAARRAEAKAMEGRDVDPDFDDFDGAVAPEDFRGAKGG